MDPVLQEIYKTVLDAAPYVLAAYLLLWIGLMGYIAFGIRRVSNLEKELAVVEDAIARRTGA
jgi:CcmD family protein